MKKTINFRLNLYKLSTLFACLLSAVLALSANSSTCLILNQPEEPKEIERFKFIK